MATELIGGTWTRYSHEAHDFVQDGYWIGNDWRVGPWLYRPVKGRC
jgi:hypothetical protein